MSLLKQENELEDKSIYYVQNTNRISNWEMMEYNWLFLPSTTKTQLDNKQDEVSAELLKIYNVPVKFIKKWWEAFFEKIDNTEIKIINITNTQLEKTFNFNIQDTLDDIESNILDSFSKLEWYLDSDKNLQKNLNMIMDTIISILRKPSEIDIKSGWNDIKIKNYINYEANIIHNLFSDLCNSLKIEISNAILLNTVGASFWSIINNVKSYLHLRLQQDKSINQNNEWSKVVNNQDDFNKSIQTLNTNILSLNTLFQEDEDDKTIDPRINELEKTIWSFIWAIKKYPDTKEEIMNLHEWLSELWKEFLINSFGEEYDILDAFIQYRNNIAHIENNIWEVLKTKDYSKFKEENQTTDTLSARDLFNKICKYSIWNESDNLINSIKKLQEYENKEIKDLLSNDELQKLLNILTQEEEYVFAARIAKILGIDTE